MNVHVLNVVTLVCLPTGQLAPARPAPQVFSDWPTIPQLYLGGEFIGGADIVIELFQSGELQEMIEVAAAS